jgi:hypothetical protein
MRIHERIAAIPEDKLSVLNDDDLRERIRQAWRDLRAGKDWGGSKGFFEPVKADKNSRVYARMSVSCCMSCSLAILDEKVGQRTDTVGVVYWHKQDAEFFDVERIPSWSPKRKEGKTFERGRSSLAIRFSIIDEGERRGVKAEDIAERAIRMLSAYGVHTEWDGTGGHVVFVTGKGLDEYPKKKVMEPDFAPYVGTF